jgi:protein-S-isoprenylcysteine O-methyltransferase Ste14
MNLLLKNLLFTLIVPGTVAVLVPLALTDGIVVNSIAQLAVACELLTVGAAIYAWCVWDFASFGRGTPAPIDPPRRLVIRGLYRWVRNPMYVGVLFVIAGMAVLFGSWAIALYGCMVATMFHLFITLYEEPHLEREFGEDYVRYRGRVRRWLPGPPRAANAER